jgi:hypothetical protein
MKQTAAAHELPETTFPRALLRSRCLLAAGLTAMALTTSGCDTGKTRIESSSNIKELWSALYAYHEDKKAWPDKLDQGQPYLGKQGMFGHAIGNGKDFAALLANPLTGDNPGYEYVKPKEDDPGRKTIMIYQLRGGKRDEAVPVGFKDGSVRDAKDPR